MVNFERNNAYFCIVGTQRTGTTFLRTSLDSHPRIFCAGELFLGPSWPIGLFQRHERSFKGGYWQHARSSYFCIFESIIRRNLSISKFLDRFYGISGFEAVGFKFMLSQLRTHPPVLHYLRRHRIKIVHLTRRNILGTLISRTRARHTGTYHLSKHEVDHNNLQRLVYLEETGLLSRLRQIHEEDSTLRALFGGSQSYLNVCYEDFCSGDNSFRDMIFNFLHVEAHPLSSDLQKIVNGTLEEVIENSDHVYSIVKNSEFAYCLDAFL